MEESSAKDLQTDSYSPNIPSVYKWKLLRFEVCGIAIYINTDVSSSFAIGISVHFTSSQENARIWIWGSVFDALA